MQFVSFRNDRLIEILGAAAYMFALSRGAVGHQEEGYVLLLGLAFLVSIIIWATVRSRDPLFRALLYPSSAVLGFIVLVIDMAEVYGGFRENSWVWSVITPRLLGLGIFLLVIVLGVDQVVKRRQGRINEGG